MTDNQTEYENYLNEQRIQKKKQTPLVLAILGFIFSPFFGLGGILSVISLILALNVKGGKSTAKTWAIWLAVGGIVFAVLTVVTSYVFTGRIFFAFDFSQYLK